MLSAPAAKSSPTYSEFGIDDRFQAPSEAPSDCLTSRIDRLLFFSHDLHLFSSRAGLAARLP
jgi:hypothetical protein